MLHCQHVVLPQVAEWSPAGLALREGVILHPTPAGKVVEIMAGVYGSVEGFHD